ncbi:MAG: lipocalin family protein, partial [Leptospira sp.]|nr:lipocalin family protein [Leptospira sp.]
DGSIQTVFTFREGSFDGPEKIYKPRGFVRDKSNAIWGMQFIWPIEAEYLIVHLDENYSETIIARSELDYVWIMARTPSISKESYETLLQKCEKLGYERSKIKKAPQKIK